MRQHNFLLILFLSLLLLLSSSALAESFRFVFMTDIHVQPELRGAEGFRQAIAKANEYEPDFVITGGDLIMDALDESETRALSLFKLYQEVCRGFAAPVYNTIGNHECFGVYEKSGIQPDHPLYGKEMFKKELNVARTYTSFDHQGWRFILLDAIGLNEDRNYIGEVDSTQLAWLSEDLKRVGTQTPIIVVLHIPLFSIYSQTRKGGTEPLHPKSVVHNSNEVISVFQGYNLKLVLQGHLHIVEEIFYRDVHYIIGGSVCGEWWKGAHDGFPEGFVVVDVKDGGFSWKYVTFGWDAKEEDKTRP